MVEAVTQSKITIEIVTINSTKENARLFIRYELVILILEYREKRLNQAKIIF